MSEQNTQEEEISEFYDKRIHYYPNTEDLGDAEMRVIALGTGMPTLRESQASTCFLVEIPSVTAGEIERFLFDFGTGSMTKFAALQIPYEDVRKAFITHLHSDHWGDFWAYWIGGVAQGRVSGLEVWGPAGDEEQYGTREAVKHALDAMKWDVATREEFYSSGKVPPAGQPLESKFNPSHTTREEYTFEIDSLNVNVYESDYSKTIVVYEDKENGIVIKSWPANHARPGAVSYSLEWNGLKFAFSGDTAPLTEEFSKFKLNFKDCDLLVHECFTPANAHFDSQGATSQVGHNAHDFHTTPEDYGELMRQYEPRHAVAYHFYNDFDTSLDTYNRVRESYKGELTLAKDHLVWNVSEEGIIVRNIAHHPDSWVGGKFGR